MDSRYVTIDGVKVRVITLPADESLHEAALAEILAMEQVPFGNLTDDVPAASIGA